MTSTPNTGVRGITTGGTTPSSEEDDLDSDSDNDNSDEEDEESSSDNSDQRESNVGFLEEENEIGLEEIIDEPEENQDTDEDYFPEMDAMDLAMEKAELTATKYPEGLTESIKIGSVSLGKVPLKIEDLEDIIIFTTIRLTRMVQAAQAYNPIFIRLTRKNALKKIKELGALPAMIQDILSNSVLFHDSQSTKRQKEKIVELLGKLEKTIADFRNEIEISNGRNSVRLEMYYASTLNDKESDVFFPEFDVFDLFNVSVKNVYFQVYSKILKEISDPLMITFCRDNKAITNYDELSSDCKRMLLCQSEALLTAVEFPTFSGKIMKKIRNLNKEVGWERQLFSANPELVTKLPESDRRLTTLKSGLSKRVMPFPEVEVGKVPRYKNDDIVNRLPEYVQMFQSESMKNVTLKNQYATVVGSIIARSWCTLEEYKAATTMNYQKKTIGVFDLPPFEDFWSLHSSYQQALMKMLAQTVVNAYDFEWHHTVKEKTKKNSRNTRPNRNTPFFCKLADFPTTVKSMDDFLTTNSHVMADKVKKDGVCDSVRK